MVCLDENLFISDDNGDLKQFSVKEQKEIKDYGTIHENSIQSIGISDDNLFTSDWNGNL